MTKKSLRTIILVKMLSKNLQPENKTTHENFWVYTHTENKLFLSSCRDDVFYTVWKAGRFLC